MRYDAAIFDLFGTLIDFLPDEDYERALAEISDIFRVPLGDFKPVWSATRADRDLGRFGSVEGDLGHALDSLGLPVLPGKVAQAAQIRLDLYTRNLEPRAGAVETLTKLRAMGLKTGLITVCASEMHQLWGDSALAPLMDAVVFSCIEGLTKPDPEIYLAACHKLQVTPERCLYLGDGGYTELAGAKTVGMHPVMIKRGCKGSTGVRFGDIEEWSGDYIRELPEILTMVG